MIVQWHMKLLDTSKMLCFKYGLVYKRTGNMLTEYRLYIKMTINDWPMSQETARYELSSDFIVIL